MITQKTIDYQSHSRPTEYFIVESQLRSGVNPVYRRSSDRRFGLALSGLFLIFAALFLALELGAFDWIYFLGKDAGLF